MTKQRLGSNVVYAQPLQQQTQIQTQTKYFDGQGNEISQQEFDTANTPIVTQNRLTSDEFMLKETGYSGGQALIKGPVDEAFAAGKKAEEAYIEKGLFGTGVHIGGKIMDPIFGKTVYGAANATELLTGIIAAPVKKNVYELAERNIPEANISAELARAGEQTARIGVTTPLSIITPATYIIKATDKQEATNALLVGAGFGALGAGLTKGAGFVRTLPIIEQAPKAVMGVNVIETAAKYGPTLYYGANTVVSGGASVVSAAVGDKEFARKFEESLGLSLAGGKIGMPIGKAAVDVAFAAPKVVITAGLEAKRGQLVNPKSSSDWETYTGKTWVDIQKNPNLPGIISLERVPYFKPEAKEIISASPDIAYKDLFRPKVAGTYKFATEKQLQAITEGRDIPLPQERGIKRLIDLSYKGKAVASTQEAFPGVFEKNKPLLFRTGSYKLPEKPSAFMSEEPVVYTAPGAISTIGLTSLKSQGQSISREWSLFDVTINAGKVQIIQPEAAGRLPTSKSFSNIKLRDVAELRKKFGVDLSKAQTPKFEVPGKVSLDTSLLKQEAIKIAVMKGRPIKGKFIGKSILGKDVTGMEPEIQNILVDPVALRAGKAYPTLAYTLGRGGESEIGLPYSQRSITKQIELAPRNFIEKTLGSSEAVITFGGKAFPAEGYTFKADIPVKFVPSKETQALVKYENQKTLIKKDLALSKRLADEQMSRGERTEKVSIFSKAPVVKVSGSPKSISNVSRGITSGVSSMSRITRTTSSVSSGSRSSSSASRGYSSGYSRGFSGSSGRSFSNNSGYSDSISQSYNALNKKRVGYDVYVRKGSMGPRGKNVNVRPVLVVKGLPYGAAVNRGLSIADKYSQRTAIIRPSRFSSNTPDELIRQDLLEQFRPLRPKSKIVKGKNDEIFVEKSKFAIDTQEEKAGIPYKAAKLAKARKMSFGSFGGMRV
jgi:hypothetical protein